MASTERRRRRWSLVREWQLVVPLALFFAVFVFAPLGLLALVSLHNDAEIKQPGYLQYVKFLTDRFNLAVLGQTLWLGAKATLLALVIGYPLAYLHTLAPRRVQRVLIMLIVLPLLTSAVVRTFEWDVIRVRQATVSNVMASHVLFCELVSHTDVTCG